MFWGFSFLKINIWSFFFRLIHIGRRVALLKHNIWSIFFWSIHYLDFKIIFLSLCNICKGVVMLKSNILSFPSGQYKKLIDIFQAIFRGHFNMARKLVIFKITFDRSSSSQYMTLMYLLSRQFKWFFQYGKQTCLVEEYNISFFIKPIHGSDRLVF